LNQRTRGAVAALAAVAAFASGAFAEGTAGKGSVGGMVGVPFFTGDSDTKNGQSPRALGQLQFQYAFSSNLRLALSGGYGWVGYKAGTPAPYKMYHPGLDDTVQVMDDVLTKLQPFSLTILRSFKDQGAGWVPYVGAGVNITRLEIVNDRRKIKDYQTLDSYVNWAPGIQAQGGFEYFLGSTGNVSFDLNARYAKLFSKDEAQFPSGFTGPHSYAAVNFGVNVYFWPIGHKPIETAPDAPAPDESAPAEAPAEPTPTPTPAPEPPSSPDTTIAPGTPAPDTTRAPGSLQSAAATRPAAKTTTAVSPAPALAPKAAPESIPAAGAICPAPRTIEVTSGMFGIPGAPVAPPKHDEMPPPAESDAPSRHASPEDGPTP
jgi:hypothetical protein